MAQFHFVEDYERLVEHLLRTYPRDEAMARAVGGGYREIGEIERNILQYAGLGNGMSVVDIGCGSGRLAYALATAAMQIDYLGTDIVTALLDYAAEKCPPHYRFKLHRHLSIPVASASSDMICAFSVFTHLLHHESYLYIEDACRALKPKGKLIFSFLEFADPGHWRIFEDTVEAQRSAVPTHLNSFIERSAISVWASHLGFADTEFLKGSDRVLGGKGLGQAVAILTRP